MSEELRRIVAQLAQSDAIAHEFWLAYTAMQKLSEKYASELQYGVFPRRAALSIPQSGEQRQWVNDLNES